METPGVVEAAHKRCVTITYKNPGTQPPVYIAGTLTSPQWQPVEMDHEAPCDGSFYKTFQDVDPGEYQYKFRFGTGDWWGIDETAEAGMHSLDPPAVGVMYD
jgi:hypothetical protein